MMKVDKELITAKIKNCNTRLDQIGSNYNIILSASNLYMIEKSELKKDEIYLDRFLHLGSFKEYSIILDSINILLACLESDIKKNPS